LGDGYDIPYLCNRLEKFGLLEKLSPFGIVEKAYNDNNKFIIYGLDVVDYRAIYKHFKNLIGENPPSTALEAVSEAELNQHKLETGDDLNLLYRNDINKYVEYNRQDVWLVKELEKKLGYLNLIDEIRRIGLCNFEDSTSNSIVIDNIIIKTLNQKGYIVQSKQHNHKDSSYEGAYVAPTMPGIYNNVICYDFLSLYPFTIMNFNISPDSYVKKIKKEEIFLYDLKEDEILAANGAIFTKKFKGFIPQICEWLFSKRQEYKKKKSEAINEIEKNKYDLSQTAYKILLNSIYGFMGASFTRFYSNDLAEAITLSGQNIIKYSHSELKKIGCILAAGDTDSVYLINEDLKTKEQTIEYGEYLSNYIDDKLKIYCKKNFNIGRESVGEIISE
jgi:DNA polymerase elongation subunit (family B)